MVDFFSGKFRSTLPCSMYGIYLPGSSSSGAGWTLRDCVCPAPRKWSIQHPLDDLHFGLTFMVNESKYSMHEFYEVDFWEQTIFSENADDISCAHSVMIRKFIVFRFCFSKTSWEVFFFVKPSTKASEKQRMGGLQGPNSWRNERQLTNTPPCNGMKVNRISWLHGLTLILMAFIQSL